LKAELLEHGMKAWSELNPIVATSVTRTIQTALLNCFSGDRLAAKLAVLIRSNGEQERSHFVGRILSLGKALHVAGGSSATTGSVEAIKNICRWWP
jgi:hypothetical protein